MSGLDKSRISRQIVNKLIECRRAGMPVVRCAKEARISVTTLYSWLAAGKGRPPVSGYPNLIVWPLHVDLAAGWYKAEDDVEERCMETIMSQIETAGDWHAGELALKLLKAMKPEKYTEKHLITGSQGGPITFEFTITPPDEDEDGDDDIIEGQAELQTEQGRAVAIYEPVRDLPVGVGRDRQR